ncbi:hypothetical protein ACFWUT_17290 [Streptomyces cyaneofuscatus]|uniref:hypothetical protein n=1 Tax=Streptomyces cyaneofuscatus TaxID=66883 RepID=UPI00365AE09C
MATLVLARLTIEPSGHRALHRPNAGHPPPLLIDSTGGRRFLGDGRGILVGASADRSRPTTTTTSPCSPSASRPPHEPRPGLPWPRHAGRCDRPGPLRAPARSGSATTS